MRRSCTCCASTSDTCNLQVHVQGYHFLAVFDHVLRRVGCVAFLLRFNNVVVHTVHDTFLFKFKAEPNFIVYICMSQGLRVSIRAVCDVDENYQQHRFSVGIEADTLEKVIRGKPLSISHIPYK